MFSHYYTERMIDEHRREMAEVQLNAQRFREATMNHDAPYFQETTVTKGEARLFHSQDQGSTPKRTLRLGPLMIAW